MPWGHFSNAWCISLQYHVQISEVKKKTGKVWRRVNGAASVQEAAKSNRAHQPGKEVAEERSDKGL